MCCRLHWGLCGSQTIHLYTLVLVGDMKAPSLAAQKDSYFSQGIKGHCKNALCSLSNIKRVRRHKRIPVVTESEDHYRTRRQRKEKQAVQSELSNERKSWLEEYSERNRVRVLMSNLKEEANAKQGRQEMDEGTKTAVRRRLWYTYMTKYFQIQVALFFFFFVCFITSSVYKPWVRWESTLKALFWSPWTDNNCSASVL